MSDVGRALYRAVGALLHPGMWLLMIWPMALATAIWAGLAWLFGARLAQALEHYLATLWWYEQLAAHWPVAVATMVLVYVLMAIVFIPLVLVTGSLIIGVFGMPMIVNHVASRAYPGLERKSHGAFVGSLWNAVIATAGLIGLGIVTLPLWLIPLLWPFIPLLLFTYFNQRLFRFDALAEHATSGELRTIVRGEIGKCWLLGIVLAVIGHVPVLGFFMPVLGGLAFTYFALEKLDALRRGEAAASRPG